MELAAADLKAEGWQVDINYQDDGTTPAKTVSAIHYQLSEGYRFFIGPTWGFQISAAKEVLAKNGAVAIAPAGASDINGGPSSAVFSLCAAKIKQKENVREWIQTNKVKNVLVMTPEDDWGAVYQNIFTQAATAAGARVVLNQKFNYGADIQTIKGVFLRAKARGADSILVTGGGNDFAHMLKAREELQWAAKFLSTEDLWGTIDYALIPSSEQFLRDAWAISLPINSEFRNKYKGLFKESPKLYSGRGYDAVRLFAEALSAGVNTAEGMRTYFQEKLSYHGVTGVIEFDANGDRKAEEVLILPAWNAER